MDRLSKKTITISRSFTYTYYISKPNPSKPAVLLLHGFPDSANLYAGVVKHLVGLPFQLVIPDCLGYAGTSKPTGPVQYRGKAQTEDLIDILNHEKIDEVIVGGHDWGSFLAQQFFFYQRERVAGIVLLSVAYQPPDPSTPFDLETILEMTEKHTGYPRLAYWELFTAPDGVEVIESHLESFWTALHGDKPQWMLEMFCTRKAMRTYLENDERVSLKPFAQDEQLRNAFIERFERDGFSAPLCWYRAMKDNVHYQDTKHLTEDRLHVPVPMLYVGSTGDAVCLSSMIEIPKAKGLIPDLTFHELECGHWIPFEKPDELGAIMTKFLTERFI